MTLMAMSSQPFLDFAWDVSHANQAMSKGTAISGLADM